jgi:hypothetical protein
MNRRDEIALVMEEVFRNLKWLNDSLFEQGTVMIPEIINVAFGTLSPALTEEEIETFQERRRIIHSQRDAVRDALKAQFGTAVVYVTDVAAQYRTAVSPDTVGQIEDAERAAEEIAKACTPYGGAKKIAGFRLILPDDQVTGRISTARLSDSSVRRSKHLALMAAAVENKQITEGEADEYMQIGVGAYTENQDAENQEAA